MLESTRPVHLVELVYSVRLQSLFERLMLSFYSCSSSIQCVGVSLVKLVLVGVLAPAIRVRVMFLTDTVPVSSSDSLDPK